MIYTRLLRVLEQLTAALVHTLLRHKDCVKLSHMYQAAWTGARWER